MNPVAKCNLRDVCRSIDFLAYNLPSSCLQMKAHLDLVADALLRWVRGR